MIYIHTNQKKQYWQDLFKESSVATKASIQGLIASYGII